LCAVLWWARCRMPDGSSKSGMWPEWNIDIIIIIILLDQHTCDARCFGVALMDDPSLLSFKTSRASISLFQVCCYSFHQSICFLLLLLLLFNKYFIFAETPHYLLTLHVCNGQRPFYGIPAIFSIHLYAFINGRLLVIHLYISRVSCQPADE